MTTHVFKPDMPPPGNRIGIVAWARANLFSSWLNTLLTLFAFYGLADRAAAAELDDFRCQLGGQHPG